jgi:hypothetical protein
MAGNTSPSARQRSGGDLRPGLGMAWLSIPFLLLSVIVPSMFAIQQMSFLRRDGADLHMLGAGICAAFAIIGAFAGLRMMRFRQTGRNYRTATFATLAGTVIFVIGAAVIFSTDNTAVPTAGGIHGEAVQ